MTTRSGIPYQNPEPHMDEEGVKDSVELVGKLSMRINAPEVMVQQLNVTM